MKLAQVLRAPTESLAAGDRQHLIESASSTAHVSVRFHLTLLRASLISWVRPFSLFSPEPGDRRL